MNTDQLNNKTSNAIDGMDILNLTKREIFTLVIFHGFSEICDRNGINGTQAIDIAITAADCMLAKLNTNDSSKPPSETI